MSSSLLEQITAAVADEYDVVGELGESTRGSAFLARERAGGHLVVLAVPPSADELSVLAAVSDQVPANAGTCTVCGHAPPAFTVHCQQCGRAFVLAAADVHRFTAAEVTGAAGHTYELLGEVAHQSGGSLFFVRDRADGRLVALAAQRHPSGGVSLEAVWDAVRGRRGAAVASVAPGVTSDPYDPSPPEAGPGGDYGRGTPFDPGATVEIAPHHYAEHGTRAVGFEQPPGYPPEFRSAAGEPDAVARPRRRWVPLVVAGAVLVAAGGAWAAMHGERTDQTAATATGPTPPLSPPTDSGRSVTPDSASFAVAGGGGRPEIAPPPIAPDSAASAREAARRAALDSARRARLEPAFVQLEGALPAGWSWTINGKPGPSSLTGQFRANRPAVLTIEAPGYCPEVLNLQALAPGAVQRWAPRLRGKPMVGEC